MTGAEAEKTSGSGSGAAPGRVRWLVLLLLVLVYALNFIDRQILAILADEIERDLGIGDAALGFLYGTVFALFYALFGIPMGRLADCWSRKKLLSLGLVLWSAMTALSGLARGFPMLAAARTFVGIGEASATPAAYALLSDHFPRKGRALALSIYSSGIYLGIGLSLYLGGLLAERWNAAFPGGDPWFGLVGWRATFLAVGLPGLALAFLVTLIPEPPRGIADGSAGSAPATPPRPLRVFLAELAAVLPPFPLFFLAARRRMLRANLAALLLCALLAGGATRLFGEPFQWLAIFFSFYAAFSFAQTLAVRDPPAFALVWKTPPFVLLVLCFGLVSMIGYAREFWNASYAMRAFGADRAFVGLVLGGGGALSGFLAVISGGFLADLLRRRDPAGRIKVAMLSVVLPAPLMLWQYQTASAFSFYVLAMASNFTGSLWVGLVGATLQDLVLPRMRGLAAATYLLGLTLVGLGLGPFLAGRFSELFGDLGRGMQAMTLLAIPAFFAILAVHRQLGAAEESRHRRAALAGEPGADGKAGSSPAFS